jgi:histidine triad (HIT) family protein
MPAMRNPDCRFCAIVAGEEEAAHVVFEDETSLAFLDHRPLFPGHCLLVPRDHHGPSPMRWESLAVSSR